MIHVNQLHFSYGNKQTLFQGLNLKIEPGKIYGLLGKNGMGKSTLLKLMAGLLFPKSGTIALGGTIPGNRHPDLLGKLFFLGETLTFPDLSIVNYIKAYRPFYPAFSKEKLYNILSDFEVEKENQLKQLSFGQQKKFLLAFALATNVDYLLLDEPVNGLDIPSKGQFRKAMVAYMEPHQSVIISTHQIRDLSNLLDVVIIMDKGKIVLSKEIFELEAQLLFTSSPMEHIEQRSIYAERVPGGYVHVSENKEGLSSPLEMEIFFNAVLQEKETILEILKYEQNGV